MAIYSLADICVRLQKASKDKALAVSQFECCFSTTNDDGRDFSAVSEIYRIGKVQLTNFGCQFEIDQSIIKNSRSEFQADTKFLEFDFDTVISMFDRNWKFAFGTMPSSELMACRKEQ